MIYITGMIMRLRIAVALPMSVEYCLNDVIYEPEQ